MDFSLLTTEILVALIGLLVLVVGLVLPDRGKQLVGKLSLLAVVRYSTGVCSYSFSTRSKLF